MVKDGSLATDVECVGMTVTVLECVVLTGFNMEALVLYVHGAVRFQASAGVHAPHGADVETASKPLFSMHFRFSKVLGLACPMPHRF